MYPLGFLFTPLAGEVLTLPTLYDEETEALKSEKHAKGHSTMQPQSWEISCTDFRARSLCARLSALFTHTYHGPLPPFPDRGSSTLGWHSPSDGSRCCPLNHQIARKIPITEKEREMWCWDTWRWVFISSSDLHLHWAEGKPCWPYICRWGPTNDFNPVNIYLYVGPCIKRWCYSEVFQMWPPRP